MQLFKSVIFICSDSLAFTNLHYTVLFAESPELLLNRIGDVADFTVHPVV